jgi:hypothetical protein
MRPLILAALLALAGPASARDRTKEIRSDDIRAYLADVGRKYDPGIDDDAKLYEDIQLAVGVWEAKAGKTVTYKDTQKHASFEFYMNQGEANFNPNSKQTGRARGRLEDLLATGPILQIDALYEALDAAEGNVTMAFGSLAEIYCLDRKKFVAMTADMDHSVADKNYYRFAGAFIGLQDATVRTLGEAGAYANMAGNPVVYAGAEVYQWWAKLAKTGTVPAGVDTLRTLGPEGNGNLVDKSGQLSIGMGAAKRLRKPRAAVYKS